VTRFVTPVGKPSLSLLDHDNQGRMTLYRNCFVSYLDAGMTHASSPSRSIYRRWWMSVVAVGGGALIIGYFLDPKFGHSRRKRLAARSSHMARLTTMRIRRGARYLGTAAYRRMLHRLRPVPASRVEGRTLLDRVESELFANRSIPHGRLNFEVEDTTVVLRGELDSRASIAGVEDAVRRIPGVSGIKSLLHLTGTPAPNKAAALQASARALEYGSWPPEPPPDVDSEH
jgi:osmotically-inducible protein OsmY